MKKEKNAFTLVELLSVIVILGITFMFVIPSLTELFTMGNKTETELIEERVLSAAKEYVNKIDGTFYTKLYKEGDTNYIYKSDLINAGLITEEEVSKLNTFAGVKGEVLKNDRIRYTVEYINASSNEYTNEELYLMIKNIQNDGSDLSEIEKLKKEIRENKETINNLLNKDSDNNIFLKNYPIGSIYMSENSTSPKELFGGEWESYGVGRTLVGVDNTQTEFATVGKTGGEKTHILTIDEMPSHNHNVTIYESKGVSASANYSITTNANWWNNVDNGGRFLHIQPTGGSEAHNNLQPYITVYMWKRIA